MDELIECEFSTGRRSAVELKPSGVSSSLAAVVPVTEPSSVSTKSSSSSSSSSAAAPSFPSRLRRELANVFLPVGFPKSVEDGYLEYQLWDLVQGLTSYLRSNLAIKELLAGLGVGDVAATASAGALGWIMLNGASMLGGLAFTWWSAREFGFHVRQWRLFADVINDVGLTLNMLAPLAGKDWFLLVAALGSVCTAMCGVAAGATKPSISQFFARDGNLSDLCAKEGSQETAVNLIGLVGGYVFLSLLSSEQPVVVWTAFVLLTVLHVVANVYAVRTLRFRVVNECRFRILFGRFQSQQQEEEEGPGEGRGSIASRTRSASSPSAKKAAGKSSAATKAAHSSRRHGSSLSVAAVGDAEPLLPWWRSSTSTVVTVGTRLAEACRRVPVMDVTAALAAARANDARFVVVVEPPPKAGGAGSPRLAHVLLHPEATAADVIEARFHAELRLLAHRGGATAAAAAEEEEEEAARLGPRFIDALKDNGWDVDKHLFDAGDWRYDWRKDRTVE